MKKIFYLFLIMIVLFVSGCGDKREILKDEVKNNFNKTISEKDIKLLKNISFSIKDNILLVNTFTKENGKKIVTDKDKIFSGDFYYEYYGMIIKGTAKNGKVDGMLEVYEEDDKIYKLKAYSIFDNGNPTKENYYYENRLDSILLDYENKKINRVKGIVKSKNFELFYGVDNAVNTFYSEDGIKIFELEYEDEMEHKLKMFDKETGELKKELTLDISNKEIKTVEYEKGKIKNTIEESF